MVLPFQAHEVACHDVHEAQLPAVLIDVEVRHRPHDSASGVKDALLAHFVLGWSGMLVMFQPDQSHGFSFPSGACVPEHLYYHHLGSTILEGPYSPECLEGLFCEVGSGWRPRTGQRSGAGCPVRERVCPTMTSDTED